MKRLAAVCVLALAMVFGLGAWQRSMAYPGADGYDSGSCYAHIGLKMGLSNWFHGTGQIIAIDVDDNSKVNMTKVTFDSDLSGVATFTATTGLSRKEIYRANRNEKPTIKLWASNGSSCLRTLDGSM
jgi:hypothetical protein